MEGSETTSPVPEAAARRGLGAAGLGAAGLGAAAAPLPASAGLLPAGDAEAAAGDAVPGADTAPPDDVLPAVADGVLPRADAANAGLAEAEDGV